MGQSILQFQDGLTEREKAIIKIFPGDMVTRYTWKTGKGWAYRPVEYKGYWTAKRVAKAFNITEAEVRAVKAKEVEKTNWTEKLVLKYISDFIERENRWPEASDFKKCVENKIPSRGSIARATQRGDNSVWDNKKRRWVASNDRVPTQFRFGWTRIQWLITHPPGNAKQCDPKTILTTPNVTVRRAAIENYGFQRMIKKGIAVKEGEDEFGILWRIPQTGDVDLVYVEVINKTAEPDGSFAHYFLRVPPEMDTPQQAIAWTFGVPTDEEWQGFKIDIET